MLLLQVQHLSFRHSQALEPLFKDVHFTLYSGDKIALLGHNGVGKTTLLNLLLNDRSPDEGSITRSGSVSIVQQEDKLETAQTLREALLSPELLGLYQTMLGMERANLPEPLEYANVVNTFTEQGGFEQLQKIEADISVLGFSPHALDQSVMNLSGGQRRLLKLLSAFLQNPDVLILDEPTNYLDERSTLYLIGQIKKFSGACLLVSHDRWFLDQTVSKVLELEHRTVSEYTGNFSVFREIKEANFKQTLRKKEKLETEISKLQKTERTYKIWGNRKEKEKSGAYDKGFIGARAARLQKRSILAKERITQRIETLQETKPWVDKQYNIFFEDIDVPTGTCLVIREVAFRYEKREWSRENGEESQNLKLPSSVLDSVSLTLEWGEHIALQGDNGSGKSTLIKLLLGELQPQRGEVLWSKGIKLGYLPQLWQVPKARTPAELFTEDEAQQARILLGALHVKGDSFYLPLGSLSEGQKRKVSLVKLLLSKPNVLILDEPTTHLDYDSVEMLGAALAEFAGTLILVTHDKYLRDALTHRSLEL
jgi:ATPase subunit of ABC transporter with duplicated ATPase domains